MITEGIVKKASGQYDCEVIQRLNLERKGISAISNLESCSSLVELSLASNEKDGLGALVNLQWLDLKANLIASLDEINNLISLVELRSLFLANIDGGDSNPVCRQPGYTGAIMRVLPHLTMVDGSHIGLIDASGKLEDLISQMKPDESAIKTPPLEPWFTEDDLRIDTEASDVMKLVSGGGGPGTIWSVSAGSGSAAAMEFVETIEMQERVAEKLSEESGLLLKKATEASMKK